MKTADVICKNKEAAITALDTIAGTMANGTPRDVLLAIKKWVDENVRDTQLPEEIKAKMASIFKGTEWEQKGDAWIEREMKDPAYVQGQSVKGLGFEHKHHKMIHEPEHGAELVCFWNAHTKAWEPCHSWPIIARRVAKKAKSEL
jgi:hypothetical protein